MKQAVLIILSFTLSAFSFTIILQKRNANTDISDSVEPTVTWDNICEPHARCMHTVYDPFTKEIKQNSTRCRCARTTICRKVQGDHLSHIYKCQHDEFAETLDRHLTRQATDTAMPTEDKRGDSICQAHTPCMWTVYEPSTRKIEYNFTHVCHCGPGTSCLKTEEENLSISAYIYKCKPDSK